MGGWNQHPGASASLHQKTPKAQEMSNAIMALASRHNADAPNRLCSPLAVPLKFFSHAMRGSGSAHCAVRCAHHPCQACQVRKALMLLHQEKTKLDGGANRLARLARRQHPVGRSSRALQVSISQTAVPKTRDNASGLLSVRNQAKPGQYQNRTNCSVRRRCPDHARHKHCCTHKHLCLGTWYRVIMLA